MHSSADQTRFERVQMPVDQRILMMKVVKLFRAASRGCAVARMALVPQLTDQLGAFGLAPIFTTLPNRIGRRCRHIEVMRVALQRLHYRQRDRSAAAKTC